MNAEFNWWLLIVGLVVGAGLVWFVVLDSRRREADVDADEREREAVWLAAVLADEGWDVAPEATIRLLELHRRYLEAPPPDEAAPNDDPDPALAVAPAGSEVAADQVAIDASGEAEPATPAPAGSERSDDDRVGVERGALDARQ